MLALPALPHPQLLHERLSHLRAAGFDALRDSGLEDLQPGLEAVLTALSQLRESSDALARADQQMRQIQGCLQGTEHDAVQTKPLHDLMRAPCHTLALQSAQLVRLVGETG